MDHELLKRILIDNRTRICNEKSVPRRYEFDPNLNYVLIGLRRAGKTTIMHRIMQDLAAQGISWDRIIYFNFEDERLSEFTTADFNDLVSLQSELSDEKGYFFFDEIQNIPHWEKFCRRMADAGERVYVTGSNAVMLSSEIATTLGGRYLTKYISPYDFSEYLSALNCSHDEDALLQTKTSGRIRRYVKEYLEFGGFPEALRLGMTRREYLSSVSQKILLGDIVARNSLRNEYALRLIIKKVAESVCTGITFSRLHNLLKAVGLSLSKDSIIDYVHYAEEAFLLFEVSNYCARFVERESSPKLYFGDNGILNLYLIDGSAALLENAVALALKSRYEEVWYFKSSTTGIDIDFYIPDAGLAVQVAWSIKSEARKREINNLEKFAKSSEESCKLMIVTFDEEERISLPNHEIEVVPLVKFLLGYDGRKRGK